LILLVAGGFTHFACAAAEFFDRRFENPVIYYDFLDSYRLLGLFAMHKCVFLSIRLSIEKF
jgi:hypothetical protein